VSAASYGNNSASTTTYNARLQPSQFRLTDVNSGASYIRENYSFWDDGRLQSVADLDDTAGNNPPATLRFLSRSYGYDQAGRVTDGYSANQSPFRQTYGYDEFDNMTSRAGSYYWQPYQSATFTYTNNRHNGWNYDADGQVSSNPATTTDDAHSFYYDASGRLSRSIDTATNRAVDYRPGYDGDGKLASEWSQITQNGYPSPATSSYAVRSTVIGEVLTRLDQSGNKSVTNVPAEGLLFASQGIDYQGSPYVGWTQRNPLGITETGKGVYDPLGNYIPFQQHDDPRPPAGSYNSSSMSGLSASMSNPFDYGMGCFMDAVPTNCNRAMAQVNSGSAYVGSIVSRNGNGIVTQLGLTIEQHYARGREVQLVQSLWFFRDLVPGSQPQESMEEFYHRVLVNKDFLKRLGGCLRDLFKVNPFEAGFVNNADGSGGRLTFISLKTNDVSTVTTDAKTFDSKELGDKERLQDTGFGMDNPYGLTMWSNPWTNYIARDHAKVKGNPNQSDYLNYLAIQVHEDGNSISMLLGDPLRHKEMENAPVAKDKRLRALDRDAGMALEECVFGADTTLYNHR
jgi:hypothetical protein